MDDDVTWSTRLLHQQGWSDAALEAAVASGRLVRVRRGTYSPTAAVPAVRAHRQLVAATLPGLLDDSVLSHASAAVLHGLPVQKAWLDHVQITRPGRGHGHLRGVVQQSRAPLSPADVVEVNGFHVTSLERTAVDLARGVPYEWGVIECDAALHRGVNPAALVRCVEQGRRWSGNTRARACVGFADARSESPLESLSRVQFARFGLPTPELQFEIRDGGVLLARCDFAWPDLGVVGECDGRVKYGQLLRAGQSAADAVMAEKRREEDIRHVGWWLVRWGWREAADGFELDRLVRRALQFGGRARSA